MRRILRIGIGLALSFPGWTQAETIVVTPEDNLDQKIREAEGGDIILIQPGEYSRILIGNRHFTPENPLIIRKDPSIEGAVTLVGPFRYTDTTLALEDSSYIVIENIRVSKGLWGVYAQRVHHVTFRNLEVFDTGQEGIRIKDHSRHVDIIHCRIHDTGNRQDRYGEGIYLGTKGSGTPNPDPCEYIWIEGCEIWDTGVGEGIDISSDCFHITVRGNHLHDITPGASYKRNPGLIYVSQFQEFYQPEVHRDVWIERNTIENAGLSSDIYKTAGIYTYAAGAFILNNTITNCGEWGIIVDTNSETNNPMTIYGNKITHCRSGEILIPANATINRENPGENPHRPQSWYDPAPPLPDTWDGFPVDENGHANTGDLRSRIRSNSRLSRAIFVAKHGYRAVAKPSSMP